MSNYKYIQSCPADVAQTKSTGLLGQAGAHIKNTVSPVTPAEQLVNQVSNQADHLHELVGRMSYGIDRLIGSQPEPDKTPGLGEQTSGPIFHRLGFAHDSLTRAITKFEEQLRRLNEL